MASGEAIRELLAGVEAHDGVTLSPVERLLLATDGTVTHMLEALTRGPVTVNILNRDVSAGSLDRQVVLEREQDGSPLVWAESDVNLYPMDAAMEDELVRGDIGIGDLLREQYAETRRELVLMEPVWHDTADFPAFIDGHSALYLKRTYKVYSDGDRIMTITEFFAKGLF